MSTRITTPAAPTRRREHLYARPVVPVHPRPCGCGHPAEDWKDDGIAGGMSDDRNNVQTGTGG